MERDRLPGTLVVWPGVVLFAHVSDGFSVSWGSPRNSTGLVSVQYDVHGEPSHAGAALMTDTKVTSRVIGSAVAPVLQQACRRSDADLMLPRGIQKELKPPQVGLEAKVRGLQTDVPLDENVGGGPDDIGDVSWICGSPADALRWLAMNAIWIGLGVAVVAAAAAAIHFVAVGQKAPSNSDLGTVSSSWLTENRSRKDP